MLVKLRPSRELERLLEDGDEVRAVLVARLDGRKTVRVAVAISAP